MLPTQRILLLDGVLNSYARYGPTTAIRDLKMGMNDIDFYSGGRQIADDTLVSSLQGRRLVCVDRSPHGCLAQFAGLSGDLFERLIDRPVPRMPEVTSQKLRDAITYLNMDLGIDVDEVCAALTTAEGPHAIMAFARAGMRQEAATGLSLQESLSHLARTLGVADSEVSVVFGCSEHWLIQIVQTLKNCGLVQALSLAAELVYREMPGGGKKVCDALSLLCSFPGEAASVMRHGGAMRVRTELLVKQQLANAVCVRLSESDVFAPNFPAKYGEALVVMETNSGTFGSGRIVYTREDRRLVQFADGEEEFRHAERIIGAATVRTKSVSRAGEFEVREFTAMGNSHPGCRFQFFERCLLNEMEIFGFTRASPGVPIAFRKEIALHVGEPAALGVVWTQKGVGEAGGASQAAPPSGREARFHAVGDGVYEFAGAETMDGVVPVE